MTLRADWLVHYESDLELTGMASRMQSRRFQKINSSENIAQRDKLAYTYFRTFQHSFGAIIQATRNTLQVFRRKTFDRA